MPVAAKFQVVQSLVLSRSTNLSAQIQPFNLALRPLFFHGSPFEVFKGRTVDVSDSTITVEITGNSEKIDAFESLLNAYGIVEMVRSGKLVIARGSART